MRYKMLMVEDYELTATTVSELFKALGFEVDVIDDGLKVLPYLSINPIDIIILDLELPGMTGDKIYEAIRSNQKLRNIPIISFTSHREINTPGSHIVKLLDSAKGDKYFSFELKEDLDEIEKPCGLLDKVTRKLLDSGKNIPKEMADYYMRTRKKTPQEVIAYAKMDHSD